MKNLKKWIIPEEWRFSITINIGKFALTITMSDYLASLISAFLLYHLFDKVFGESLLFWSFSYFYELAEVLHVDWCSSWYEGTDLFLLLFTFWYFLGNLIFYYEDRKHFKNMENIKYICSLLAGRCLLYFIPLYILYLQIPKYLNLACDYNWCITGFMEFCVGIYQSHLIFLYIPVLIFVFWVISDIRNEFGKLLAYWILRALLFAIAISVTISYLFTPTVFFPPWVGNLG